MRARHDWFGICFSLVAKCQPITQRKTKPSTTHFRHTFEKRSRVFTFSSFLSTIIRWIYSSGDTEAGHGQNRQLIHRKVSHTIV